MKTLKYLSTTLIAGLYLLPANLLAFWAPGNGNTDGPPNGAWVGPHWDLDWVAFFNVLPFV